MTLRYSPTDGRFPLEQVSTSGYFNMSQIYYFVPRSLLPPEVTEFRLQMALRVRDMTGPFAPQDVGQAQVIGI